MPFDNQTEFCPVFRPPFEYLTVVRVWVFLIWSSSPFPAIWLGSDVRGECSTKTKLFTVHRSMKNRSSYVYSAQKSFSVILILVVTFTVVIFSQIQSKKSVTFTVFSFGHLYSVILTSLQNTTRQK